MCDASDVVGHDRRTPELSNAPLYMKQDTISIENNPPKPVTPSSITPSSKTP